MSRTDTAVRVISASSDRYRPLMATVTCRLTVPYRTLGLNADVVCAIGERALDAPCDIALVTFDGGVAAPLDRIRWLPSAGECEIITVPNRDDRHIQRGGQL